MRKTRQSNLRNAGPPRPGRRCWARAWRTPWSWSTPRWAPSWTLGVGNHEEGKRFRKGRGIGEIYGKTSILNFDMAVFGWVKKSINFRFVWNCYNFLKLLIFENETTMRLILLSGKKNVSPPRLLKFKRDGCKYYASQEMKQKNTKIASEPNKSKAEAVLGAQRKVSKGLGYGEGV